jgi:hypothetical protein
MDLSIDILQEWGACSDGRYWFITQEETNHIKLVEKLIKQDKIFWAHWLISRTLGFIGGIKYVVYVAKTVLYLYESEYPKDFRLHKIVELAEGVTYPDILNAIKESLNAIAKPLFDLTCSITNIAFMDKNYAASGVAQVVSCVCRALMDNEYRIWCIYREALYSVDALVSYMGDIKERDTHKKQHLKRYIQYGLELLKEEANAK